MTEKETMETIIKNAIYERKKEIDKLETGLKLSARQMKWFIKNTDMEIN